MSISKLTCFIALAAVSASGAFGANKIGTLLVEESAVVATLTNAAERVGVIDERVEVIDERVEVIANMMAGSELNSPNIAGIRVIFNTGANAYVPQGEEYYKAINGAYLVVEGLNRTYRYDVTDIRSNATQRIFIPCTEREDVTLRLVLGPAKHIYTTGAQIAHAVSRQITDVLIDTTTPVNPPRGDEERYRMYGRAQFYDPANARGKQASGESFPIQRIYDSDSGEWITQFGHYEGTTWVTECDIYNQIAQLDMDGGIANLTEVGNFEHAYETRAFPWCEVEPVVLEVDSSMLNTSGGTTPATNLFYFARCPIYAYKETIETIEFRIVNGGVTTTNSYPVQIHWVAHPDIMEVDAGFGIPSWEKVYKRVKSDSTGDWTTELVGQKEANYYAVYKSAPTSAKNNNWQMAGGNSNYTIQSYPWPNRDGSDYGVSGLSRGTMHTYAQKLNAYSVTLRKVVNGTEPGQVIKVFPAPTGDMATRRWAGNNWHDYQAFRELAYIQFGANAQNTTDGIIGNNTTSAPETRQDELEEYYEKQPNLITFTIAPRSQNGVPFSWLRILNFWGSEGDQMADATVVAQTDFDGTQTLFYLANLDRSLWKPDFAASTDPSPFFNDYGYERLSYNWAHTGQTGTYYRGKPGNSLYAAFNLPMTTPSTENAHFAVNLSSSAYDGCYAPSYPAKPGAGSAYSYWMCSLSGYRSIALGPWCVHASSGPSHSSAVSWGCRASPNFLATEGEAQSGE